MIAIDLLPTHLVVRAVTLIFADWCLPFLNFEAEVPVTSNVEK